MVPAAVGPLALFGFVANMGIAITPQSNWTQTQAEHYVQTELDLSDLTGHPLAGHVVRGDSLPTDAPIGQLFVRGDSRALHLGRAGSAFPYPSTSGGPSAGPHTPICRSLLRQLGHGTRSG